MLGPSCRYRNLHGRYGPDFFDELRLSTGYGGEAFGYSTDVSGNVLISGGSRASDFGQSSGAVYFFQRSSTFVQDWTLIKRSTASNPAAGAGFGNHVVIDGAIAAALAKEENIGWVVYIFEQDQGGPNNWGEIKRLVPSEPPYIFNKALALEGENLLIGGGDTIGAAYLYSRNQGGSNQWGLVKEFVPAGGDPQDAFGSAVGLSGHTVFIGDPDHPPPGSEDRTGVVYVYEKDFGGPSAWGELKKLAPDNPVLRDFAVELDAQGDHLVVGGAMVSGSSENRRASHVFRRDQGGPDNWGQVKMLVASDGEVSDGFGVSVAVNDDEILVGAVNDDVGDTPDLGSAYLFSRNEGGANNWGETAKFVPSTGSMNDDFGISVALAESTYAVGASQDDLGGPILNNHGAVYVYFPTSVDLALETSDSQDPIGPGELLTYTFDISNQGPSDCTGASFTDLLPDEVSFVVGSPTCQDQGGTVTCNVAPHAVGNSVQIVLDVLVQDGFEGLLTNSATVTPWSLIQTQLTTTMSKRR